MKTPYSLLALLKSPMNFERMFKGAFAVVSLFCTHAQQYSGSPGEYWVPISCKDPTILDDDIPTDITLSRSGRAMHTF